MSQPLPASEYAESVAVLASGGLDSAVLLGETLDTSSAVYPLYVRTGAVWEETELQHLRRFLHELRRPALRSLTILDQSVRDLYGNHWSMTAQDVPDAASPDEAVFLPGRNVLLLSKSMLWCHLHDVSALALAPLAANPFPDATPSFFRAFQDAVNQSVAGRVNLHWPYLNLSKAEVLRRGARFPLRHTFSCLQPARGLHCAACNKCAERRLAFAQAGIDDPTEYARR